MVPIVGHRCTIKLVVVFWCKSRSEFPLETVQPLQRRLLDFAYKHHTDKVIMVCVFTFVIDTWTTRNV
jgi:hypothetical protein